MEKRYRRPTTQQDIAEFIRLTKDGKSVGEIVSITGFSDPCIRRHIYAAGLKPKPSGVSRFDSEYLIWENRPDHNETRNRFYRKQREGARKALEAMNA